MSSPIVGRLMKMLLSCGKPDLALELFYGKEQFGALLASVDKADLSPIKASLTTASGCDSSSSEVHHPAIYNYAMEGWAQIGKWPVVRLVYDEMCSQRPNLVNRHTHKQMTRIILQNNEPLHINLNDSELYWLCASSLERLSQQHDTNNWETAHLTESFLLWTALLSRRSANVVPLSKALSLAADLPHHCRYASCITIGLVLHSAESLPGGKTNADAAIEVFDTMASHPYCSLKQICLASVLLATKADPTLVSGDRFDEKVEKTITSKIRFFVKTQDAMNAFIDLLVEYACAVERRQSADPPEIPEGALRQRHLLASTLDTMYGRPTAEHFWLTVTGVIQSAAEATGFSPAYAAPALVSAGVSPQIAMSILQHSL
ncbi:hypothetical protein AGDE_15233 [Angomonas deanei]|uniref:Uncharacterized protein n=1 Tax=Angomonas deanei TaxID=59799 RepID=A0A7G2CRQ2_9TRYP|nr:hypothetical protein AGDE_15233 [Angomonas deanei]CAD2222476.1 hypothetical protein, conserved [Angomonas deanei]|eukprot:EPY19448.1 hypothetical protein AGDE_15233 [Angomonas deanei]